MKKQPTYAVLLPDGRYEVGVVVLNLANRRKDRDEPRGVVASYDEAVAWMDAH